MTKTKPDLTPEMAVINNTDFERAVLAMCMMGESIATGKAVKILTPNDFYDRRHQLIFQVITKLCLNHNPIDMLTVHDELELSGNLDSAGGSMYVVQLPASESTPAAIEYYAYRVLQYAVARNAYLIAKQFSVKDKVELVQDVKVNMADLVRRIGELQGRISPFKQVPMADMVADTLRDIEERKAGIKPKGLPTGIDALDAHLGGLEAGDFILIAARPSLGKTDLALNIAYNVAINGQRVIFFTLEMTARRIIQRLMSRQTAIFRGKLNKADVTTSELSQLKLSANLLNEMPLVIHDKPGISIPEIQAVIADECSRRRVELVIVDYIGLITPVQGDTREQEVSQISKSLKNLAREFSLPVVVISQLNRGVESRQNTTRVPELSDLRDSGSLEQDADIVMMLYGEWYYKEKTDRQGIDVYVRKYRNGERGLIEQVQYNRGTGIMGDNQVVRHCGEIEYKQPPKEKHDDLPF